MADFFDTWDKRRERATAPPSTPVSLPTPGRDTAAYAAAALRGEVDNLIAVPIGQGRNDQLNKSAVKMYGYVVAGLIDEHTVTETLGAADGGLDHPATRRTLQSARDAVFTRLGARAVPESVTAHREAAPWETSSDDPFADHYTGPRPSTSSASSSTSPSVAVDAGWSVSSADTAARDAAATLPNSSESAPSVDDAEARYKALLALEASRVRLNRDARRVVDHEDAVKSFRVPEFTHTLTDELAIPDEPITYFIDQLVPSGGNVLLAAQFKAGKTTLVDNLARSWADLLPFLGRYAVDAREGRLVIFNYELSRDQHRRWLRETGIENTDRVSVLPLRGYRLPLLVPIVEDWVVDYLKARDAAVWIVDPFARAASGSVTSENDNTEVGAFLEALDVIKRRAGVGELILPTHTGRAEHEQGDERARGATRLDDWADVRWLLTKDKSDTRYFRATGRDVDTDEAALAFDPATRLLTITGGDRWTVERESYRDAVIAVVENRPGIGVRELRDGVKQIMRRMTVSKLTDALDDLVGEGRLHVRQDGHTKGHYLGRGAVGPDPFG